MDANLLPVYDPSAKRGPIYGTLLVSAMQLGDGATQLCPTRADLDAVRVVNVQTVGGYEILLRNYHSLLVVAEDYESTITDLNAEIVALEAQVASLQSLL
jgi:hypothetical protein